MLIKTKCFGEIDIAEDMIITFDDGLMGFEDYHQYVIWFIDYQEGNYEILDNTFKNNGQTAGSHCAVRFQSYTGAADGKVNIEFGYNTVDNSYSLIRFDAAANRTKDNTTVKVNYNKLLNCAATYFVNNNLTFAIDATAPPKLPVAA